MSTTKSIKLETLRQEALANIDLLFHLWGLNYIQVNDDEYDFINPNRNDKNFGACRFNVSKGLGADFTGTSFQGNDYRSVGLNFDKSDFASFTPQGQVGFGYDIIGLVQRLFNLKTYGEASKLLEKQLKDLAKNHNIKRVTLLDVVKKKQLKDDKSRSKLIFAKNTWQSCSPVKGTHGEKYLHSRAIYLDYYPKSMRFHPRVMNAELKSTLPALLFSVTIAPESELVAIHRIYLSQFEPRKAQVNNPKMALGSVEGAGIWFGEPNEELSIIEGPENALSAVCLGYPFAVSTVNAANYSNILIPEYVKRIVLFGDPDQAGVNAIEKAKEKYKAYPQKVIYPPKREGKPKFDLNEYLQEIRGNGKEIR